MVAAQTVKSLAERYARAEALVAANAIVPVAGLEGYSVVRNGDGTHMYLVRHEYGHEHCTCPDFTGRQAALGLPCKHLMAAQLIAAERAKTASKSATRARGREALALLNDEDDQPVNA